MTLTWAKFAEILVLVTSLFMCYTLWTSNSNLRDANSKLTEDLNSANANITLQQELTKKALDVKEGEQKTTQTVIKYVDRVDRVMVKENPKIAEDANQLWKEALNAE